MPTLSKTTRLVKRKPLVGDAVRSRLQACIARQPAPFVSDMVFGEDHKGGDRSKIVGGRARRQASKKESTIRALAQTVIENC